MQYEERIQTIIAWLTDKPNGVLRRYTPPDRLGPEQVRAEVMDIAEQMNADIPGQIDSERLAKVLHKAKFFLQRRHGRDEYPSIKVMLAALDDALKAPDEGKKARTLYELVREVWQNGSYMPTDWKTASHAVKLWQEDLASWPELRVAGFAVPDEFMDEALGKSGPSHHTADMLTSAVKRIAKTE